MAETDGIVVKAVAVTAGITILIAAICFYLFYRYAMARWNNKTRFISSFRREDVREPHEFSQRGGTVKGVLVDEDGLEVLYLRRLEGGQLRSCVSTVWFNPMDEDEKRENKPNISKPIQEIRSIHQSEDSVHISEVAKPAPPRLHHPRDPQTDKPIPPPVLHPQASPLPPLGMQVTVAPLRSPPSPPPPPSQRPPAGPPPPPPPPPPAAVLTKVTPKPSPPPMPGKGYHAAAPFQPRGLASSLKPPTAPRGKISNSSRADAQTEDLSKGNSEAQMKMKPFHWDKVNTNFDHSLVWNEINDGSFRFDDELMETLFGYDAAKRKSPEAKYISSSTSSSSNSASPAQIFILDPRKSQNTAIVLKSLSISRKEILDALLDGRGLNGDTLEKLTQISPTQEETSKILEFAGNPTRLADGESFLYHILKAIPSAFIRINAMLFRSNYDPEILHLKESLQTLEFGCKELRNRGIFLKLLEAILKAGNRMNAGTAKGNAQGFNLSALRKISYVKSTDGKTTLLHFVVEQVLRSEGKRCLVEKTHRLGRSNSKDSSDLNCNSLEAKEERDKECIMLGLPILGGLSSEFSNVKKAATIDYDNLMSMSPNLTVKVGEIRQLVTGCGNGERGGFVKEMKGFLEECEDELKVVREEQKRVMELVRRTTEFYQAGASKEKGVSPLQIFGFVKDFLDKVDQVCIDVTKKLQKKNANARIVGSSSPPLSPTAGTSLMYKNLQSHFGPVKDRSSPSSSESDEDF